MDRNEKKEETLHNYEQPTAGTRVSLWNVIGMYLTVTAVYGYWHMLRHRGF
jgi:hypothetical protein